MNRLKAMELGRKLLKCVLALLAMLVIFFVAVWLLFVLLLNVIFPKPNTTPMSFSAEAWQEQPDERFRMVDSLMEQHDFSGMTCGEVMKILGQEEWREEPVTMKGEGYTATYRVIFPVQSLPAVLYHEKFIAFYFDKDDLYKYFDYFEIVD